MKITYSMFAGQSLERLAALSDGIFAVAMTLLVLDLRLPAAETAELVQTEQMLWDALVALAPRLLTYLMSFLTLGIFWMGQQTELNFFSHTNRSLTWIHIAFLMAVSLLPFSTKLLADFITLRLAVFVYWLNLLMMGAMLYASWTYAKSSQLLNEEVTPDIYQANKRRIIVYQALYAVAMLLCIVNTTVSLAFLIFFQLNAVLAPRRLFDSLPSLKRS